MSSMSLNNSSSSSSSSRLNELSQAVEELDNSAVAESISDKMQYIAFICTGTSGDDPHVSTIPLTYVQSFKPKVTWNQKSIYKIGEGESIKTICSLCKKTLKHNGNLQANIDCGRFTLVSKDVKVTFTPKSKPKSPSLLPLLFND
jgi:hypothetical protein